MQLISRFIHRGDKTYRAQQSQSEPRKVELPRSETGASRTRECMVIVVPAFAVSKKRYPPYIDAVVFNFIIFVAELGLVTDDIEKERHLLYQKAGKSTDQGNLPSAKGPQYKARSKTNRCICQM